MRLGAGALGWLEHWSGSAASAAEAVFHLLELLQRDAHARHCASDYSVSKGENGNVQRHVRSEQGGGRFKTQESPPLASSAIRAVVPCLRVR